MLVANINYPEPHIRLHRDEDCPPTRRRYGDGRRVEINPENRDRQVAAFRSHDFGSKAGVNQMWVEIDLQDPALEQRVLLEIRAILVGRYEWFDRADWQPCRFCG